MNLLNMSLNTSSLNSRLCFSVVGKVGFNFGAGMTGGKAIVLSTQKNFKEYVSKAAPEYRKLNEIDILELRTILELHIEKTDSKVAKRYLKNKIIGQICLLFLEAWLI